MPRKQCAYGFSCAAMLMQPGLETDDCPNKEVCGTITTLTEEEHVTLAVARREEEAGRAERHRIHVEQMRVAQREAALLLLMQRGNPQTSESLGLDAHLTTIRSHVEVLSVGLARYDGRYVAPPGCEAHRYTVKRPSGTFWYNKLSAREAMFHPAVKHRMVKVIHLSRDDDERNITAREGIETRNKLLAIKTKLGHIEEELAEILATLER